MQKCLQIALVSGATIFFSTTSVAVTNDSITHLPGFGKPTQQQYSGYAKDIFYWYVASKHNPSKAPIIIWSSGGPGSSSLYGFFMENGPYAVNKNLQLTARKSAWSDFANYLVLDQPMGIGLSFTNKKNYPKNPKQGNQQYYQSLQAFFTKHPELRSHDIYLSGESYAGTYMALLAQKILKENKNHPATQLHLKGLIVISGWVSPTIQQSQDSTYAYNHGLISKLQKHKVDTLFEKCQANAKQNGTNTRLNNTICSKVGATLSTLSGLELHNIGLTHPIDDSLYVKYLNQSKVRQALHAKDTGQYSVMTNIWDNYASDVQNSYQSIYKTLLKAHLRIMIQSGMLDGSDCNFLGTRAWLEQLTSSIDPQFWLTPQTRWTNSKQTLGYIHHHGNLTWVKVLNAGHMIPISQPKSAELIKQFCTQH